jgi:hypothetical protein
MHHSPSKHHHPPNDIAAHPRRLKSSATLAVRTSNVITDVYYENHTKHINMLRGQNAVF